MHDRTPTCQPQHPPTGETSRNVPHDGGTPCPTHTTPSAPLTHIPAALQWVSTTESRHAGDPYSWMQAVHWIHGSGLYTKRRSHGPGFGDTTVRVAQALAQLTPCRPGVDYLARVLRMSERSVQYHLEMLRETGLLAYITRGTRISGTPNQASEFARVIPPVFDHALGIRTIGEGVQRRPVGIAEEHRGSIAKLARKAARKIRKRRRNTNRRGTTAPSARQAVCTPMQSGSDSGSVQVELGVTTTGTPDANDTTTIPSSTSTATRGPKTTSRKTRSSRKAGRKRRTVLGRTITAAGMNRGHRLAAALRRALPWTRRATHNQLRWVCADMAEQGWTDRQAIDFAATAASLARGAGLLWQPDRPQHLIARALLNHHQEQQDDQARREHEPHVLRDPMQNTAWRELVEHSRALAAFAQALAPGRTDEDRRQARARGRFDIQAVIDHLDQYGDDDTLDLYGTDLTARAGRLAASAHFRTGAAA